MSEDLRRAFDAMGDLKAFALVDPHLIAAVSRTVRAVTDALKRHGLGQRAVPTVEAVKRLCLTVGDYRACRGSRASVVKAIEKVRASAGLPVMRVGAENRHACPDPELVSALEVEMQGREDFLAAVTNGEKREEESRLDRALADAIRARREERAPRSAVVDALIALRAWRMQCIASRRVGTA